ncbi:MAG: NUDIX hydrolase [Acidobacteriaceae bacterium]
MSSPAFGKREPSVDYTLRPSAYVILTDASANIATTRSPHGHFLPGGGIDTGESAEQAAIREAYEECGFIIAHLQPLCQATQYVHSRKYQAHYEKRSTFFTAAITSILEPTEPSHQLIWLEPMDAIRQLTHESHAYAIRSFLNSNNEKP